MHSADYGVMLSSHGRRTGSHGRQCDSKPIPRSGQRSTIRGGAGDGDDGIVCGDVCLEEKIVGLALPPTIKGGPCPPYQTTSYGSSKHT